MAGTGCMVAFPKWLEDFVFHKFCGELRVSYCWIKDLAKSSLIWLGGYASGPQPDRAGGLGILGAYIP